MDLENLNKEYTELKKKLEIVRGEIDKIQVIAKDLELDKKIQEGELAKAQKTKDDMAKQNAEKEIKKINEDLKKIKEEALVKIDSVKELKGKIDDRIKQIKENPEMKKHLEEVMFKKYDRKLSKLKNEKNEIEGKKTRLTNLKEVVNNHSSLANNLKGIMLAKKEIKDLKQELESLKLYTSTGLFTYKDPARANEIQNKLLPDLTAKITKNKSPLMAYISKNGLEITEKDIDELSDKEFKTDAKGNIDLNLTMNRSISGLSKELKGYEKSIKNHQIAINNLGRESSTSISQGTSARQSVKTPPVSSQKPKWYQFIKRFKNWNEKRKQPALPAQTAPEHDDLSAPAEPEHDNVNSQNEFINSLKYDVVKDIVAQIEKDDLKTAKKERKSEIQRDSDDGAR